MTAAAEQVTREELRKCNSAIFRRNAFKIIAEMLELSNHTEEDTTPLVDEILHSIFFLGEINNPQCSPESIFGDKKMLKMLKYLYPQPFELYSSQLPRRTPFSCVLDMIVCLTGQENEKKIKEQLQNLIHELKESAESKILFSFTICVSQINTSDSVRYYGVSMSTSGANAGRIMVAASCCSAWDDYVAGAVMTYCPKKTYFDGTIILPEYVRCEAFNLSNGREMNPCRSCGNLFGLHTTDTKEFDYGNCAEVESVSNLLKNETQVKEQARPTSEMWTNENRQRAKDDVLEHLKCLLRRMKFKWDNKFYTPQSITKRGEIIAC